MYCDCMKGRRVVSSYWLFLVNIFARRAVALQNFNPSCVYGRRVSTVHTSLNKIYRYTGHLCIYIPVPIIRVNRIILYSSDFSVITANFFDPCLRTATFAFLFLIHCHTRSAVTVSWSP